MNTSFPTAVDNYRKVDDFPSSFDGYYPLGFKSELTFQQFVIDLYMDLPVFDGTFIFQGSSIAGESYKLKAAAPSRLFDHGRVSDYDIALASETLFAEAKGNDISTKNGDHTEPLKAQHITLLGLDRMQANADARIANRSDRKRDVHFMIYDTIDNATKHTGASLICPEPAVLRMGTSIQIHNYILGDKKFRK